MDLRRERRGEGDKKATALQPAVKGQAGGRRRERNETTNIIYESR